MNWVIRLARRKAAEELGIGSGCLDGACVVNPPQPGGQHTNGGCNCTNARGEYRYRPGDREAAAALIAERAAELLAADAPMCAAWRA